MFADFGSLDIGEKFYLVDEGPGDFLPTHNGRLWEKIKREKDARLPPYSAGTADDLYPVLFKNIHRSVQVDTVGCDYCNLASYAERLEAWKGEYEPCSDNDMKISQALDYTYGVLGQSPTCRHLINTVWDIPGGDKDEV